MKCRVCRNTIPADRRRITNVKTCSEACSGILQARSNLKRQKSYRQRRKKALREVSHEPLGPGIELKVRRGHVVGLQRAGEEEWSLVRVVRATQKGRATHVCVASRWEGEKATAATLVPPGSRIAVLPPDAAQDEGLALELEEVPFDWEYLRQMLGGSGRE